MTTRPARTAPRSPDAVPGEGLAETVGTPCSAAANPAAVTELRGVAEMAPPPDPNILGVKITGSASEGHRVQAHPGMLAKIFGTDEPFQSQALLAQCLKVLSKAEAGDADDVSDQRGFMFSVVKDLAPRDVVERMLAVQMAATHVAMIRAGRAMATCTLLSQLEAHSTNFNKLARTYAAQMEALRKHRTGGRQTVVVQHVTVAQGGQAIVGHVETGSRTRREGVGPR